MRKYEMRSCDWCTAVYLLVALFFLYGREASGSVPTESSIRSELKYLFDNPVQVAGYPFQQEISAAAMKYNLPLPFVMAVARGESFFDPKAKSAKGALGIMQVMPETAGDYGVSSEELLDPAKNIDVGVHLLSDLYGKLQDPYLTLAAYYCGYGGVDKENTSARQDCDDYVRYIYTHMQTILTRAEPAQVGPSETATFVVARFDNFLDSERFLTLLSERLADVNFDLFRKEVIYETHVRYQYQVTASTKKNEARVCRNIKEITGFAFCEE